jgi:hypothetical protein
MLQLQVNENKDVIFFPSKFTDPLDTEESVNPRLRNPALGEAEGIMNAFIIYLGSSHCPAKGDRNVCVIYMYCISSP